MRAGSSRQIGGPFNRCQRCPRRVRCHPGCQHGCQHRRVLRRDVAPTTTHGEPGRARLDHTTSADAPSPIWQAIDRDGRSPRQLHDASEAAWRELHQQVMSFDLRVGDRHVARRSSSHEIPARRKIDDTASVRSGIDSNAPVMHPGRRGQSRRFMGLAVHDSVLTRHRLTAARSLTHRSKTGCLPGTVRSSAPEPRPGSLTPVTAPDRTREQIVFGRESHSEAAGDTQSALSPHELSIVNRPSNPTPLRVA